MTRGRKPKPTSQKLLAGNPGKRAINKTAPSFTAITHVDPPDWLDEIASTMWEVITSELISENVLAVTDLHNVEIFCEAYSRYRAGVLSIAADGVVLYDHNERAYKNPAATIVSEALRQIAVFGSVLGLDPAARARIMSGTKKEAVNSFSEF